MVEVSLHFMSAPLVKSCYLELSNENQKREQSKSIVHRYNFLHLFTASVIYVLRFVASTGGFTTQERTYGLASVCPSFRDQRYLKNTVGSILLIFCIHNTYKRWRNAQQFFFQIWFKMADWQPLLCISADLWSVIRMVGALLISDGLVWFYYSIIVMTSVCHNYCNNFNSDSKFCRLTRHFCVFFLPKKLNFSSDISYPSLFDLGSYFA